MKKNQRLPALFMAFLVLLAALTACAPQPDAPQTGDPPAELPEHECQSPCTVCGACLDAACFERACVIKCRCGKDGEGYDYYPAFSKTMPAIHINTPDGSNEWATKYNRGDKLAGLIAYTGATVSTALCEEEHLLNGVAAEVKVRGNYTLGYPKKPIRIKFAQKQNLLGLHDGEEYKSWVLLAEWKDLSMLNNTAAFYLGNTLLGSEGLYCTDFRHVKVYLNGEYYGVYLLAEQQEAKDGRTSVPAVPKGYTGNDIGYFFEYDAYYELEAGMTDGDPTFVADHIDVPAANVGYTVKSDINANTQLTFLQNYVNNVFYIAYQATRNGVYYKMNEAGDGVVPAPEYTTACEAVGAVIDLPSLVSTYILNEIACDLDVDWSSFYLSLDLTEGGNGKVTFEAPWDFDSAFGTTKRRGEDDPVGLYAAIHENPWFRLVVDEAWFTQMVCAKWSEARASGIKEGVLGLIALEKELYAADFVENYTRWPERVTNGNSEVVAVLNDCKDIGTAQSLAADHLMDWLEKRFAYLDTLWGY